MNYLISTTEVYRVADEEQAKQLIEDAKNDSNYELVKYSATKKDKKEKGEVVDEWIHVSLVKNFNLEKEPDRYIEINYEVD
jgi:hypothetical protein